STRGRIVSLNFRPDKLARWANFAGGAPRRGDVALLRVIHHHSVCVEAPTQSANGALHALDPASREAVAIALVEERNQFVPQHAIQILAIAGVMYIHVGVGSSCANRKSVEAIEGFCPPAVQH